MQWWCILFYVLFKASFVEYVPAIWNTKTTTIVLMSRNWGTKNVDIQWDEHPHLPLFLFLWNNFFFLKIKFLNVQRIDSFRCQMTESKSHFLFCSDKLRKAQNDLLLRFFSPLRCALKVFRSFKTKLKIVFKVV